MAAEQLRLAGNEPARGWPAYSVLLPEGNPAEVIHDPGFNAENFWNAAADYGWLTGAALDPPSPAPRAAEAGMVDPGEFSALDENARLMRPLVGRGFQVWELGNRAARKKKLRHDWLLGVR